MKKKLFSGFAMLITLLCCLCLFGCGQQWRWHEAKDSTCDQKGNIGYYTLDGKDGYFNKDKVPVNESDVFFDALGHDWGEVTYTWSQDNAQCTATVVCANNSEHVQTETVNTTTVVTQTQTCDNAEIITHTAVFTNPVFRTQTITVQTKDALGHDWGDVTYTWSQDNTQCTATRVCGNNGEHVETETVTVTTQVTQEQTCDNAELTTFTATFTNPAFATQIQENVQTKEALGHAWGEVTYTWAQDNTQCTATRVCGNDASHVETETVDTVANVTQQQSCENPELTTYTATFTNTAFVQQIREDVQTREALGHAWGEVAYVWSQDNSQCTATRVCGNDNTHIETETVDSTADIEQTQTCENAEITRYTAVFTNPAFETQVKSNVKTQDSTGHNWGTVTYTWSADNSECTARRVCVNDSAHVQEETVSTTADVTQEQSCLNPELTRYTATFTNPAFATQIQENVQTQEALGHAWGEATYTWSNDNTECTARRVCGNDETHVETETVNTVANVTQAQSCVNPELTRYTATFTNTAFETQIRENVQTKAALGHAWGEVTYTWSENNTKCTARRVCANDNTHIETETVNATTQVTQEQTCEDAEITRYTATFTNAAFATQTTTDITKEALGHNWGEATYTWSNDNTECTATRVCTRDASHVETETVDTVANVTQAQSCVNPELTRYTATFTNTAFVQQTKENVQTQEALGHDYNAVVTAPTCTEGGYTTHTCSRCGDSYVDTQTAALGHNWGEVTYTWSQDNTKCTATRVCTRNGEHVETETVDTVANVTQAQSCVNPELTRYTATFINPAFETQIRENVQTKAALGGEHNYIYDTEKGKYVCTICGDEHNQTDSIYLQTSGTKLTGVDDNFEGALFVPNGITAIENSALYGNTKITEVYFPGTVQSVGQQAFRGCSGLTKVVFAEGVEVLDSQAFALCANLTDVSLPNTLTTINQNCFRQSSQLVNVNLPESLQRIGMYAFAQTGLTSVVVPSGLQDMDEYIFGACPALRTAIISEGITKVPNGMFRSCQALESIELPEGITEICDFAFDDCTSLTHVDFPSTLVEIKKAGFRKSALTSIVLPDGFKTLGIFVFEACTALKTAQLPNTLEEIGKCTFQGCVNLEQVNLPSSLKYIGNFGFNHCSSLQLTTITIPASVVQLGGEEFIGDNEDNNIMGSHMFYDCATGSLIAFEVEEGNTHFVAKDGVLYTKNYKYLISYPAANTRTSYEIEDGCEMAFELAFSRAHYLETLKLPNSFTVLPRTQLPEGWVNDTLNSIDAAVYVFNSISAYEVNEDNPNFKVVDGILYSKDGTKLISVPTRKWDSNGVLYFSEDLTTIDIILNALDTTIVYNDHEVGGCPSMIVLGAGVTNIGENGFYEISSSTVKILSEATARPSGWAEDLGINENKIYYYSETEQEGNYWHYVNDVPTVWGN